MEGRRRLLFHKRCLWWIGLIIAAQAFQTTPRAHAPAIALGLMPAISAWGLSLLGRYINVDGKYSTSEIHALISKTFPDLKGILIFSEGPLLSAMFLTSVIVYLIERDFLKAFYWTLPLILCSFFGFIHSSVIGIGAAGQVSFGYVLFALVVLGVHFFNKQQTPKNKV